MARRITIVALIFVFALVLSGCVTQADVDAAYQEGSNAGFEEGYAWAKEELEKEINKARISGFAEGYEKGRSEGFDAGMNTAASDSLKGEYYRNEYYDDDDYRALEDMIRDEVYERSQRIMAENEELRERLDEYDIGFDY